MRPLALAVLLVAGCATPQRHAELLVLSNGSEVVTYPADLRGAYIANGRSCAEPMPDVALVSTQKLAGTLKLLSDTGQSIEATAAADLAAKVAELSGRTQLVLLARDVLFRLCEMNADQQTSVALFGRVLDMIEHLAQADQDKAAADLLHAAALKRAGEVIDGALGR